MNGLQELDKKENYLKRRQQRIKHVQLNTNDYHPAPLQFNRHTKVAKSNIDIIAHGCWFNLLSSIRVGYVVATTDHGRTTSKICTISSCYVFLIIQFRISTRPILPLTYLYQLLGGVTMKEEEEEGEEGGDRLLTPADQRNLLLHDYLLT